MWAGSPLGVRGTRRSAVKTLSPITFTISHSAGALCFVLKVSRMVPPEAEGLGKMFSVLKDKLFSSVPVVLHGHCEKCSRNKKAFPEERLKDAIILPLIVLAPTNTSRLPE